MQSPKHEIKRLDNTKLIFMGKGVLVGCLSGVVVSLFRLLIDKLSTWVMHQFIYLKTNPQWLPLWIIALLLAAILVSYLVKSDPNIKGSGIPQIEGQLQGELFVDWFSVLWKKFVGGVISVGSGLFLGREGPSIQLGAMIGQGVNERFDGTKAEEKILLSSGAAAGLAAAFNAPIAGLLFVVEEVHHSFSPLMWLTSLTSALAANLISLNFFGLQPVLFMGKIDPLPLRYYFYLVLLGILLGVLGYVYQIVLLSLPKLYRWTRLPEQYYGLIPFLLLLPVGYFFPHFLGGGHHIILRFGEEVFPLALLVTIFLLRFIFSMISYGAGLPGGIFLPILTLGSLIGGIYGTFLHQYFGIEADFIKNFVVFAMAGYFTAIGKAPLTAMILVTEMVGNFNHLMSLGVVCLAAYIVNDLLGGNPIYESLLDRLIKVHPHNISGQKTLMEYPVTAESRLDGMMVRDFKWPKDVLLVSLHRGNSELLTKGDTVLKAGDILLILTDSGSEHQARLAIKKQAE